MPRKPELDDLIVSTSGLGSLRVGKPVTESDMVAYDPDFCIVDGMGFPEGDPRNGRWPHTYPVNGYEPLFGAIVDDDQTVTRIDIRRDDLRTDDNLGLGSTIDEVISARPQLVKGVSEFTSDVWFVRDAAGSLVFEVANESSPGYHEPDQVGTVLTMRVLDPRIDPDFGVWGSDFIAGGCL